MELDQENASLTIRLPRALRESLIAAAKSQDLTASQLVRKHFTALLTPRLDIKPTRPRGGNQRKGARIS